jgi:hypothetical protein
MLDDSVRAILARLPERRRPTQVDLASISLRGAMNYLNSHGLRLAELLVRVRDGIVPGFRSPNGRSSHSIWFFRKDLEDVHEQALDEKEHTTYSVDAARRVLGVGTETLTRICLSGLLTPINDVSGPAERWLLKREDVDGLAARLVERAEAAPTLRISENRFNRWAQAGWILAVPGPKVDGAHAYRFDRKALMQWRAEHASSEAAREILGVSRRTMERLVASGRLVPVENMGHHPHWFRREDVHEVSRGSKHLLRD